MQTVAKEVERSEDIRAGRHAIVAQNLRGCWPAPVDTFITEDIPLLLTRLSFVAPIASRPGKA